MPTQHRSDNKVIDNNAHKEPLQTTKTDQETSPRRPPSTNGYTLSTESLHQLLSGDQQVTSNEPFDKAVKKQQQLMVICNLLDRQNSIHTKLEQLINGPYGACWIDQQINQFKSRCPADILFQITHSNGPKLSGVAHGENISLNFFSLINELLYTPLVTLSRMQPGEISEQERHDWYEWCLGFNKTLLSIKQQLESAREFFSPKTFDKLLLLTNDSNIQQVQELLPLFNPDTIAKLQLDYEVD